MRITSNMFENSDFYSDDLREQVTRTFHLASSIMEIKDILSNVKEKSVQLRTLLLSNEEKAEYRDTAKNFDNKMQTMMCTTFHNLEQYQLQGWKEFFDSGE